MLDKNVNNIFHIPISKFQKLKAGGLLTQEENFLCSSFGKLYE